MIVKLYIKLRKNAKLIISNYSFTCASNEEFPAFFQKVTY